MSGLPVTAADESFSHQLPLPQLHTLHESPAWGDRCYHQLHVDDLTVCAGRQLYVHDRRRYAFFSVATPQAQYCLRAAAPFTPGDDPDEPRVGGVSIEVVRPLEEVRLVADDPASPVSMDLTYEARFPPTASSRHTIAPRGEVVTDYVNFFQSGWYSGVITVEGTEHRLDRRAGFRDRGWGLRKHEGSGRRGFMASVWCELADAAVYLIFFETAAGGRAFTNGWLFADGALQDTVDAVEHDLVLDGTLVERGSFDVTWSSGRRMTVAFDTVSRCYLAGIGYALDPAFKAPGVEVYDLTDPAVVARLDGQNDQGAVFTVDGEPGHGYVETGVGVHPRYRPEDGGAA